MWSKKGPRHEPAFGAPSAHIYYIQIGTGTNVMYTTLCVSTPLIESWVTYDCAGGGGGGKKKSARGCDYDADSSLMRSHADTRLVFAGDLTHPRSRVTRTSADALR